MNRRRAACLLLAVVYPVLARTASVQADVSRGRASNAVDSAALQNATVTVTTIAGGINRSAKTDRNGRYTITFPNGDGDHLVKVVAPRDKAQRSDAARDIVTSSLDTWYLASIRSGTAGGSANSFSQAAAAAGGGGQPFSVVRQVISRASQQTMRPVTLEKP